MGGFKVFGDICGWIGTVISICFFIAPIQQYISLIQGKIPVSDVPGLMLVFNEFNTVCWVAYGLRQGLFQSFICNLIGGVITLIYLLIFLCYFAELKVMWCVGLIILALDLDLEFFWIFYKIIKNLAAVGYFTMIFNILMYAGTLEKLGRVLSTHNYNLIPILISILMLINSVMWLIYGIAYNNAPTMIPNAIGIVFQVIAIGLWAYLRAKYPDAGQGGDGGDQPAQTDKPEEKAEGGDNAEGGSPGDNNENPPAEGDAGANVAGGLLGA